MNVVDCGAWPEYLADGPNAVSFAPAVEMTFDLLVPSHRLCCVIKRGLWQRDEDRALRIAGVIEQGNVVDLDAPLAPIAVRTGIGLAGIVQSESDFMSFDPRAPGCSLAGRKLTR